MSSKRLSRAQKAKSHATSVHDAAPDAAVEPIGDARPPLVEGNHCDAVELVDVKAIAERPQSQGTDFSSASGSSGWGDLLP